MPSGYYYFTGSNWVGLTGTGAGALSTSSCIDYDGNAYPTIQIGTQVWMAENLRVTHYRNGDPIPNVTDNSSWGTLTTGAYCWYDNDQVASNKYGVLYNWYAVDDDRGLCPIGWHEPTFTEWIVLGTHLGPLSAGGKMKSVSALWNSPNTDATNNSGFSGLPGGLRSIYTDFNSVSEKGCWWTSSIYSESGADTYSLEYDSPYLVLSAYIFEEGISVRCIRDN